MRRPAVMLGLILSLSFAAPTIDTTGAAAQVQVAQGAPEVHPGRIQKLRERTKETWAQMKRRWSLQRERYAACRKEARTQRLAGRKTRQFLEQCMTR